MSTQRKLSHKQLLIADKDYKKAAIAASLKYVSDCDEGIRRVKKGKGYSYYYKGKMLRDREQLERIKKLAIPPSWSNVWICSYGDGHIQATGFDMNNRKQYRYHASWHSVRSDTKFHRLFEFGKTLPRLRKRLQKDIGNADLNEEKVLATAISLMEKTYIRVGNNDYEKLYGSYGLTTLKDKHVSIKKDEIKFCFTGKKGIGHTITLRSKKLARVIKECRDIPGKELFQYYDREGNKKRIDSGLLNGYIKKISGHDFSAKDFRTWAGSLHAVQCFKNLGEADDDSDCKKKILEMLDAVSLKLGNSRNICKKYYVHPGIVKLFEEKKLLTYIQKEQSNPHKITGLHPDEAILLNVLKKSF
jgi:DNA topoisomerase-1